ncbi:aminotransferase-like domain-containing protein [Vibrio quintilis]|uniref:aminotransferase-like domain-containing protein n=1 Tax=Vibrio quintilis TaxID=1117707 RepID=UPI000937AD97|nr:PLP-dependent aminotransferase family protein [Vibrio quintilis]
MSEIKFKQIARTIESRIRDGVYPPNTKLPPHRVLAEELQTTPVTVAKAYKLLSEQNQVESFVGRGTFVCGESQLSSVIQTSDDEDDYNFSILQPCLSHNVPELQSAIRSSASKITSHLTGYAENSGHERHRQTGIRWASQYGLEPGTVQNTLLTSGTQNALAVLVESLTKPGDTIAVETLTYPGILAIASLRRRHVVGVQMDENGMIPEHLQQTIEQHHPKLVIVVPSHQNPTGITMPAERRESIARVVRQHNIWFIEDDIYSFLNEDPMPAICNWLPERGFHVTSLSKAICPALRCGFIKAPSSQVATISAHIRTDIWLASPLNFIIAEELINSGQAFELAERQRLLAGERQKIARKYLPHSTIPRQGYHLWIPLPSHWQQERFAMEAQNHRILVSSGSYFDTQQSCNHIRLSLTAINSEQKFKQGMEKLNKLLHSDPATVFSYQTNPF